MFKDDKELQDYMSEKTCNVCNGNRLRRESLAVDVAGKKIFEVINLPIEKSYKWFADEKTFSFLNDQDSMIALPILNEIKERLFFLYDVGLGYITLDRDARSISGGEAQRIRLAAQLGSNLTGVTYP